VCQDIPTPEVPVPGTGDGPSGDTSGVQRDHHYEGFDSDPGEYAQDMSVGGPRTGLADRTVDTGTDTTNPSAGDTARSNVPTVTPWATPREDTLTDEDGNPRPVRVVDTDAGPVVINDDGTATGQILDPTAPGGVTIRQGLAGTDLLTDNTDDTGRDAQSSAAPTTAPGAPDNGAEADTDDEGRFDPRDPTSPIGPGPVGALAAAAGGAGVLINRRRRDGAARADIDWGAGREQSLILLEGPESPREYRFAMDVPDGGQMVKNPDGSVDVLDADGTVVEHVKSPWAYDASGRAVPTYYEVDNDTGELVQVVDPQRSTILPILADPYIQKVPGSPKPGPPIEGPVWGSPGVKTTYFSPFDPHLAVIEFDPNDESLWGPMTAGVAIAPDGSTLAQPRDDSTGYLIGGYNYQIRPVRARAFSSTIVDIDGKKYKAVSWQYEYQVRYRRTDAVRDGDGGTVLPIIHGWSDWEPLNDELRDSLVSNRLTTLPTP
jgi:hypothetical protein